jgi:hypothetical protein
MRKAWTAGEEDVAILYEDKIELSRSRRGVKDYKCMEEVGLIRGMGMFWMVRLAGVIDKANYFVPVRRVMSHSSCQAIFEMPLSIPGGMLASQRHLLVVHV